MFIASLNVHQFLTSCKQDMSIATYLARWLTEVLYQDKLTYKLTKKRKIINYIKCISSPVLEAQLLGGSSRTPQSCRFSSRSGHKARMHVSSLAVARVGGDRSIFLSHIDVSLLLSVPVLLSLKLMKKYFKKRLQKLEEEEYSKNIRTSMRRGSVIVNFTCQVG